MKSDLNIKKMNPKKIEKVTFRQYLKIFSGIRMPVFALTLVVIAQIASYYFSIHATNITGNVVDKNGNVANSDLMKYAVFMLSITFGAIIVQLFNGLASEKINLGLREKLWRKMMYIPQNYFDKDSGETLVSRVTTDCNFASTLFTTTLTSVTLVIGIVVFAKQMYQTNVKMANYMLLLIPMSTLAGWVYGKLKYWVGQKTQSTLSDTTSYLIERTNNLRLVKASNMESYEEEIGREMFANQYRIDIRTGLVQVGFLTMNQLLTMFGYVVVFVLGGMLVKNGVLPLAMVFTFYMFSNNLASNFGQFIDMFGSVRGAIGALARVIKIMEIPSEDIAKGSDLDVPDADIRFEAVQFGYSDKLVLDGVDCVIQKRKTTAIIGANGSGKSTLFKLLSRLYEPDGGKMLFGNTNVQEFNLHSWRRAFGVVAQNTHIMEGTIRENITYGCERFISDDELTQVAKMANVYDFVKNLPDGFDSYIAPGGGNFSGGQRQCIAIARAMMHNPDYLLLDEATSNLDLKSERTVTEAFRNLMKDRTTVIIAHQLSAIRYADNVIVLKDGRVAAYGSSQEIIKTSNDYRDFVMSQKRPACNINV